MSQWLQEERKKLEENLAERTPISRYIIAAVIVLVIIEAALFFGVPYISAHNPRSLCGIVGVIGLMIIAIFGIASKMTADKSRLPFAEKCIEKFHFSAEELQAFDEEMMAEPLALIQTNSRSNLLPIRITEHYIAAFFLDTGEADYGVFRLSDIAMTCYASSKSPSDPSDKVYDIDLLDAKGAKTGRISIDGEKYFTELNYALREYVPGIRLNVPMEEVKEIRRKSA